MVLEIFVRMEVVLGFEAVVNLSAGFWDPFRML